MGNVEVAADDGGAVCCGNGCLGGGEADAAIGVEAESGSSGGGNAGQELG